MCGLFLNCYESNFRLAEDRRLFNIYLFIYSLRELFLKSLMGIGLGFYLRGEGVMFLLACEK